MPDNQRNPDPQTRAAVYLVVDVTVTDPDLFQQYVDGHQASVARYGGRFLSAAGRTEVIEGDWDPAILVIHEWPSRAAFHAWYGSEDYRPWHELRLRSARINAILVDGLPLDIPPDGPEGAENASGDLPASAPGVSEDPAEELRRLREDNARLCTQLEEEREERRLLRFLVDAMPDFVSYVDRDLHYRVCNQRYAEIVGRAAEQLAGLHVSEVLGKEALNVIQPHVERALHGERVQYEEYVDYRFGEDQYVDVQYVPRVGPDSEVRGFGVVVRNITARKRAEEAALEQRDLLASLINAVPDVVCLKDAKGHWLLANQAAVALFDLDPDCYEGLADQELVAAAQAPFFQEEADDEALWAGGKELRLEVHCPRPGGDMRNFDVIKVPLFHPDGRRRYLVVVGRDVTELQEARYASEAAVRAKGRFLANISHEIRTPLNAIVGFSRLVLSARSPDRLHGYLRQINSSADLLLKLINEILDFSRIEAEKLTLESVPIDLRGLVEDCVWMVSEQADMKGLELVLDFDWDLPWRLRGDSLRLRQILSNLLTNAVKFTESGEVVLRVSRPDAAGLPSRYLFEVQDTGIGIAEEDMQGLFEPFVQVHGCHTHRFGGAGLGLAISNRLVELMGGHIEVKSCPGRGTCFRFQLDLEPDPAARDEPTGRFVGLAGCRVLLVDDHSAARDATRRLLTRCGAEVTEATSAAGALSALAGGRFDQVWVDLRLGDMDHAELVRRIRRQGSARIVIMAAPTARNEAEDGGAGDTELIEKPVTLMGVRRMLQRLSGEAPEPAPVPVWVWPPPEEALRDIRGARVLLVEDVLINQRVATELLESCGIHVDVADHGREAIRLLSAEAERYDLVLMDIQMPEMDGYETVRAVREELRLTDLPVVGLTAHALDRERGRGLASGMNDYLIKPIEPEQLLGTIKTWIAPRTVPAGAGGATAAAIDVDRVLRTLSGNRGLFLDIVGIFQNSYSDAGGRLDRYLAEGDLEAAAELAHDLKGTSGSLGATALYEASQALDDELRTGPPSQGTVSRFKAALGAVLEEMKVYLAEP
jgi:PAS domain S-box-containing protein